MIRLQIQLREDQARKLRDLASGRGVSVAHLVRDAVDDLLKTAPADRDALWQRASRVVGRYRSGAADVSENHDRYLGAVLDEEVERWQQPSSTRPRSTPSSTPATRTTSARRTRSPGSGNRPKPS